ncbi:uncharacterized protein LOC129257813 [Lytechinus pictus]|uniref:uncharacterized protein LOC129257813 n=1 Tax=Lytechinus pictus TaxID=7653 RepID=UPI0030B9F6D7
MALRKAVRTVSVILFAIVIKCQTSSTRAGDDDDGNSSKEYSEPLTRSSSASRALFSTVATMKPPLRRAPRGLNSNRNDVYISERVCGDDGVFYDNITELNKAGAKLLLEIFCESGCLLAQENPCSSSVPVCTGLPENRRVYENECELRRINCERLEDGLPLIEQVVPTFCELESCGQPTPSPCPTKVPVCAGHGENYTIYDDMCHVDQTRCNRKGNDLRPIISEKIGRCQIEVNESQLTCHDILRGKCPRGTVGKQVCDITNTTTEVVAKTFRNICRALHKRCKKMDDTCYSIEGHCKSHVDKYNVTNYPPRQDCARYIRHSFPMVDVGRPCYHMPAAAAAAAASKRYCRCDPGALYSAPTMPEYPAAMEPSWLS